MFTPEDQRHMRPALELAQQGIYSTPPNPSVGCVVVRWGQVVGVGFHQKTGEPHAESYALREAGKAAARATVYVTLEPCCHQGRTGPCTDALISAGVARVVIAMRDPNPRVAGGGLKQLEDAGVATACGLFAGEAEELNRGFVSRMRRGRPWAALRRRSAYASGR